MKSGSSLSPPKSPMAHHSDNLQGFRIPNSPVHNGNQQHRPMMASSYMAPRNMNDYSKLIRFSRKEGYLYRLTKKTVGVSSSTKSNASATATTNGSNSTSETTRSGERQWKKRFLVLNDGYLYTFRTKEESAKYDFKNKQSLPTDSNGNFTRSTISRRRKSSSRAKMRGRKREGKRGGKRGRIQHLKATGASTS